MDGNATQTIDEWAKHLVDEAQALCDRTDKDNPLYYDIVNFLDKMKCLQPWIDHDRSISYREFAQVAIFGGVCQNTIIFDK